MEDFTVSRKAFTRKLISIALPVAFQSLMTALVGASDALMLGRLTQDAISAVSLANQITFIMSLFIGGIVGGVATLTAQYYGKGDTAHIKKLFAMSIRLCALISIVFFAAAFLFPEYLMKVYTDEPLLIEGGAKYLRIVSWSYLFSGLSNTYLMVMRTCGRAAKSAMISAFSVITDMLIDLFLIYGLAGLPRLEIAGCAISTVAVEACVLVVCVVDSHAKAHIHPDLSDFLSRSKELFGDAMKVSVPMLIGGLVWGIGYSAHSAIMGRLGTDVIAAASVIAVVQELTVCVCRGFSSGAMIMPGELLGQDRFEDAKKCGRTFCKVALVCGAFNAALLWVIIPIAKMFFVLTPAAQSYLIKMGLVLAVYLFGFSLNCIITCGVFNAGGDSIYDAKSVAISMWGFALPLGFLALTVFKWPPMAVYICIMSDEVIKLPWIYPHYKKYIWVRNLTRK